MPAPDAIARDRLAKLDQRRDAFCRRARNATGETHDRPSPGRPAR